MSWLLCVIVSKAMASVNYIGPLNGWLDIGLEASHVCFIFIECVW